MSWYNPIPEANDYHGLMTMSYEDNFFLSNFHRDWYRYRKRTEWRKIQVEIDPTGEVGDFPSFQGHDLVFTEKSWKIMQPLINDVVEILPLSCTDGCEYKLIKILDIIDCLDYSKSVYEDAIGGFVTVESYVFHEEAIKDKHIFWFSKGHHAVVSERFKDVVEEHQLKGLDFRWLC